MNGPCVCSSAHAQNGDRTKRSLFVNSSKSSRTTYAQFLIFLKIYINIDLQTIFFKPAIKTDFLIQQMPPLLDGLFEFAESNLKTSTQFSSFALMILPL